jgi:NTE family protein
LARARPQGLSRFERIALVLSGGGAFGAYQGGAYSALEEAGVQPNWIAGTAIGAVNAAIIAGNAPDERAIRLRRFWRELSKCAAVVRAYGPARRVGLRLTALLSALPRGASPRDWRPATVVSPAQLRALITRTVDFERLNSGEVRVVLGAVNRSTGAETFFDNDRHTLTPEHVLACSPLPGLQAVAVGGQLYGGSAIAVSALDDARPANTLCFVIDGYDPLPGPHGGSRTAREIAAMRRVHDLRRRIALLGERIAPAMRSDVDIRRCLSEASHTTMTILHLVHEVDGAEFAVKTADFSPAALTRRWRAGENDTATSLAHPRWLAPPPRFSGIVVHEMRGGLAAPH